MDLFFTVGAFAVGAAFGAMGYRYMLKRDPETLERWAREWKAKTKGL